MRIILIEDEPLTAKDLADSILKVNNKATIVRILASVKESLEYFKTHNDFDLVFSDVMLSDGMCFEIFEQVTIDAPIIFCTAYDSYTLNAFKSNGIDYILKPFNIVQIEEAFKKYERLAVQFLGSKKELPAIFESIKNQKESPALLVSYKDKIIPVELDQVAIFYISDGITCLHTFEGQVFIINKTLEEVEKVLGNNFYRANRQYLVNRKAIKDTSRTLSRKLKLNLIIRFPKEIHISKEKASSFLEWLSLF